MNTPTEAYHRWTKHDLSANASVCDLMWHLRGQDTKKMRHDKLVQLKIRNVEGSYFQKKFNHSHKMNQMVGYNIVKNGNTYIVTAPPSLEEGDEVPMSQTYTLFPNPRSVCIEVNRGSVEPESILGRESMEPEYILGSQNVKPE